MIKEDCKIIYNDQIAHTLWKMIFKSDRIAPSYKGAGQFILLLPNDSLDHPLRRPMSIAGVEGDQFSIIYKTVGPITNAMSQMKPGETINVLGPLGNTFTTTDDETTPILIGGGVGLAPILNLQKLLNDSITIIGARTAEEHFLTHSPKDGLILSTDDGSAGIKGNVITALESVINKIKNPIIYACGPEPMLKALQTFSITNDIPAQLSVESYMACGIGICQGCVIKKTSANVNTEPSYHQRFDLVCKNGPVFSAGEIRFG